jgi:hypothetical protein
VDGATGVTGADDGAIGEAVDGVGPFEADPAVAPTGPFAVGAAAAAAAAVGAEAAAGADPAGADGAAAFDSGAAPELAPVPSEEITARGTPTSTVSPSWTRIAVRTPSAGDGTSESTLSVDTSNRGSSRATESPTDLNHFVMVPSVTVSPNCGIVTSGKV